MILLVGADKSFYMARINKAVVYLLFFDHALWSRLYLSHKAVSIRFYL